MMHAEERENVRFLRTGEQIRFEASAWIVRLSAEDVSEEDRARFDGWLAASPSHARAFDEVSKTWGQLRRTGELVSSVALGQAFAASTQRAIRHSQRARRVRTVGSIAASFLLAVLIGYWWVGTLSPRTVFQTAVGEHATVQLPDGSTLELNTNSRARIEYSERSRVIRLERGEAFFDVAHDESRPFWVVAGDSWVRAVGTAFNVDLRRATVRVTVSEGAVKVAGSAPRRDEVPSDSQLARVEVSVLKAGQQVAVQGAETQIRSLESSELTRLVAWRNGTVYFKNDRLVDVIDELSRYTTLRIVIEDAALRELNIGGTFETSPQGADALLATLEDGFGLQVRRDGRTAYIAQATR